MWGLEGTTILILCYHHQICIRSPSYLFLPLISIPRVTVYHTSKNTFKKKKRDFKNHYARTSGVNQDGCGQTRTRGPCIFLHAFLYPSNNHSILFSLCFALICFHIMCIFVLQACIFNLYNWYFVIDLFLFLAFFTEHCSCLPGFCCFQWMHNPPSHAASRGTHAPTWWWMPRCPASPHQRTSCHDSPHSGNLQSSWENYFGISGTELPGCYLSK